MPNALSSPSLITCHGAGRPLSAAAPDWCELIPAGTCHTRDGRGPFHLTDAAAVLAAFRPIGWCC
ncbi:hypothetical protein [uncultured Lamprocystis sp.]|jgi:hypothetical protein|uniref:hypothetical protein n=1 Tax=uncultured Lamprocystis sp. TaxID=543132 RepID=UPI0025E7A59D|nr:hypothetical protein [uncultured Lamprocystis sp.]